jgi:endonuclease-3 related protein
MLRREAELRKYFPALFATWGPQDWWPAHTRFEVIAGAYLTQNTAWSNVEKALAQLRGARALSVAGIRRTPLPRLEQLVRPAGYFRQKAQRLKIFVAWLDRRHGGSLARMFAQPTEPLRAALLELHGVGPETADSILLYAGGHPTFVVDAYTRRILARHRILPEHAPYEQVRDLFQRALAGVTLALPAGARPPAPLRRKFSAPPVAPAAEVYNECHALLVRAAKHHCLKKKPDCAACPLQPLLPPAGPRV